MLLGKQLIIFNTLNEECSIYPAFPVETIFQSNQVVLKGSSSQKNSTKNIEGIIELEYHYFATPNEIMALVNAYQCLLKSLGERMMYIINGSGFNT